MGNWVTQWLVKQLHWDVVSGQIMLSVWWSGSRSMFLSASLVFQEKILYYTFSRSVVVYQLLFYCCNKTFQPKQLMRAHIHTYKHKAERTNRNDGVIKFSKSALRHALHSARPRPLKQHNRLETLCSNVWDYGHPHSNHHRQYTLTSLDWHSCMV